MVSLGLSSFKSLAERILTCLHSLKVPSTFVVECKVALFRNCYFYENLGKWDTGIVGLPVAFLIMVGARTLPYKYLETRWRSMCGVYRR